MGWRIVAMAAGVALSGCQSWRCDLESHGACVEFPSPPADLADAQRRVDALLDRELPFWDLSRVSGWRIQFRDTDHYPCYFAARNEGCTDYLDKTISVRVPPDANGCFEASEILHELGHYALGDPMHSNARWRDVSGQFAVLVWDRPDAAAACKERYGGIVAGMWPVRVDSF
jgi:hypothetical protein